MKTYKIETDGFPVEVIDDVETCLIKMHGLMQLHHITKNRTKEMPTYYLVCVRGEWPESARLKASMSMQTVNMIEEE